jgi:hypothetical protein
MTKEYTGEEPSIEDTLSIISKIKNDFEKINSDTERLRVVTRDMEGVSSEGGFLKLLYDERRLRKAILIAYGETGKSVTEYYFKSNKLIFICRKDESYSTSIYDHTQPKIKKEEENRFYFLNGELIRWIDKNNKIVNSKEYPRKAKELNYAAKTFLDSL